MKEEPTSIYITKKTWEKLYRWKFKLRADSYEEIICNMMGIIVKHNLQDELLEEVKREEEKV